jgi:hypothetical protein
MHKSLPSLGCFLLDLALPRAGFSFAEKIPCHRIRRGAKASCGDGRKSAPGGSVPYDDVSTEAPPAASAILAVQARADAFAADSLPPSPSYRRLAQRRCGPSRTDLTNVVSGPHAGPAVNCWRGCEALATRTCIACATVRLKQILGGCNVNEKRAVKTQTVELVRRPAYDR